MTAEQLEELLVAYDQDDNVIKQKSAIGALQVLAPSLARRVIAAEKLVEALEELPLGDCRLAQLVTAYREASK